MSLLSYFRIKIISYLEMLNREDISTTRRGRMIDGLKKPNGGREGYWGTTG
jgi:hypothetical protein